MDLEIADCAKKVRQTGTLGAKMARATAPTERGIRVRRQRTGGTSIAIDPRMSNTNALPTGPVTHHETIETQLPDGCRLATAEEEDGVTCFDWTVVLQDGVETIRVTDAPDPLEDEMVDFFASGTTSVDTDGRSVTILGLRRRPTARAGVSSVPSPGPPSFAPSCSVPSCR